MTSAAEVPSTVAGAVRTMRAAVITKPGEMVVAEVPVPRPGRGQLRLRLEGCGVCASNVPPGATAVGAPAPASVAHPASAVVAPAAPAAPMAARPWSRRRRDGSDGLSSFGPAAESWGVVSCVMVSLGVLVWRVAQCGACARARPVGKDGRTRDLVPSAGPGG